MANTPILRKRDFPISAAIFEWEKDGRKSYSVSLQRSYKKKDATEYTNETINMYPEDLLKAANVLINTYNTITDLSNKNFDKGSSKQTSAPASQSNGWSDSPAKLDDDIPF